MKNVIVISSTPRIGGNSEILSEEFARGAKENGYNTEIIYLRKYQLNYCLGCYACKKNCKCFQDDGMNEIAEKLVNADVIVFSTPVYFYSMSGQLKVLIDRLVPTYTKIRADIYLIATQWDDNQDIMENTINAIRGATRECFEDCEEKGVLYGINLGDRGEVKNYPTYMKQAYEMGKNC